MFYLSIIPIIFLLIFSLLGVSLFALFYQSIDETSPLNSNPLTVRHSFKNIGLSMLAVLQILTGDRWTSVMFDVVRLQMLVMVIYYILV